MRRDASIEPEKFVGMLRVEIAYPDSGAFAGGAGEIADPSIALRLPLDAHRVVANRRARINVRAMGKAQEIELLAGIVVVGVRHDFQCVGGIGCVRVAAPWRERKIVRHERSHMPVVGNLRSRRRVVGLDQRKRHTRDVILDVAVAVERDLRGIFFGRMLKALRPFDAPLRENTHPKAMRNCKFCGCRNVTRILRDVVRADNSSGLQFGSN